MCISMRKEKKSDNNILQVGVELGRLTDKNCSNLLNS